MKEQGGGQTKKFFFYINYTKFRLIPLNIHRLTQENTEKIFVKLLSTYFKEMLLNYLDGFIFLIYPVNRGTK